MIIPMTADCSKPSQVGMLNSESMERIDKDNSDSDDVVPMITGHSASSETLAFENHNITSATSPFVPLRAHNDSNSNSSNDSGYDFQEFESREDSDTYQYQHAESSDTERQDTEDAYNLQVEIEEDGIMQIEVTRSVDMDDSCWSINILTLLDQENDVLDALLLTNWFMPACAVDWIYNVDESEQKMILQDKDEPEPEMPRTCNRSSNLEGRKKRIEHLKLNLTPFELDDAAILKGAINSKRYRGYSPVHIKKRVHSFSASKSTSPTIINTATISPTPSSSSRFQCYNLPNCGNPSVENNAALIDWDESYEEDLCYDSDPHELLVSSAMKFHSKDNAGSKQALNRVSDNQSLTVSSLFIP